MTCIGWRWWDVCRSYDNWVGRAHRQAGRHGHWARKSISNCRGNMSVGMCIVLCACPQLAKPDYPNSYRSVNSKISTLLRHQSRLGIYAVIKYWDATTWNHSYDSQGPILMIAVITFFCKMHFEFNERGKCLIICLNYIPKSCKCNASGLLEAWWCWWKETRQLLRRSFSQARPWGVWLIKSWHHSVWFPQFTKLVDIHRFAIFCTLIFNWWFSFLGGFTSLTKRLRAWVCWLTDFHCDSVSGSTPAKNKG